MTAYDKLVIDLMSACIKALDSKALPDGYLRDEIEELWGELMLESCRGMVEGIYEGDAVRRYYRNGQ